jgi:hypothetical protein
MPADRYLKVILTIIAAELLWLAVRDGMPAVSAQNEPTRVVITGVDIAPTERAYLPVVVLGSARDVPAATRTWVQPLRVQIPDPVHVEARPPLKVEVDRPIKIETDHPIKVESVEYKAKSRPGE